MVEAANNPDKPEDLHWMFGFGANLNVHHLQEKKSLTIFDHGPAKVPNYKITFPKGGIDYVDPAFASARKEEGATIHGLAYAVSKADFDICNQKEGGDSFYDRI